MKNNKIDILFLDIDSVLNCAEYASTSYDEDKSSKALVEHNVPLHSKCIEALQHILRELPELKIVWSTDWKLSEDDYWNGWHNPRKWLEAQFWMKDRVVSNTPKRFTSTHPQEIHLWFKQNEFNKKHKTCSWMKDKHYDIGSYAILDDWDDNLMRKFGSHLFLTNSDHGLTAEIADKLISDMKEGRCKYSKEELDWRRHED